LQTEEQEEGRKMGADETKTKMDANLAVARGNRNFLQLRSQEGAGEG
jgi:hypothetical protein